MVSSYLESAPRAEQSFVWQARLVIHLSLAWSFRVVSFPDAFATFLNISTLPVVSVPLICIYIYPNTDEIKARSISMADRCIVCGNPRLKRARLTIVEPVYLAAIAVSWHLALHRHSSRRYVRLTPFL
jgi:hypothetical protein